MIPVACCLVVWSGLLAMQLHWSTCSEVLPDYQVPLRVGHWLDPVMDWIGLDRFFYETMWIGLDSAVWLRLFFIWSLSLRY